MASWHAVMPFDQVPEGTTELLLGDELVLLVRVGEGLHACAATCPHKFTALAGGVLENGCITCPLHEATFDLSSGRPLPGQDWAGNLPLFPVRIREGIVEIQA